MEENFAYLEYFAKENVLVVSNVTKVNVGLCVEEVESVLNHTSVTMEKD